MINSKMIYRIMGFLLLIETAMLMLWWRFTIL